MGTASIKKFFKNLAGQLTDEAALITSAGAADADRIPALNANGVLDLSIVNGKTSSAGAADANKLAALDGAGRLDLTMMPVGVVPETQVITASEALAAGDWVNVWNSAGTFKARKADATVAGKEACGFVLAAVANAAPATVYFEGANTAVTGQVPGKVFLATTAGQGTPTAPSAAGNLVQEIGIATSATSVKFAPKLAFVLS